MPTYYDRIYTEAASCDGTGNITWTAAATQFALPPASVNTTVEYTLLDHAGTKWETGRATLTEAAGTYTITRGGSQTVLAGSNGTSAESFSDSTTTKHKLFIAPAAATLNAFPIANIDLDGGTDIGAELADADLFLVDDGGAGSNRKTAATRLRAYCIPGNFIAGAEVSVTADDAVSVSAGACETESKAYITWSSALTVTGLTLSADTWYYVYVYDNSGTMTAEVSSTAPAAYLGKARSKTGSSTHRFVGSVRTDGDGDLLPIKHDTVRQFINYESSTRLLNAGTAAVSASEATKTVSLASRVPPHSQITFARFINSSPDQNVYFGSADIATFGTANAAFAVDKKTAGAGVTAGNVQVLAELATSSAQEVKYGFTTSISTGGAFIDVMGYLDPRA